MKHNFALAIAATLSILLSSFQGASEPAFSAQESDGNSSSKSYSAAKKLSEELLELQYDKVWTLASQNFLYEDRLHNFDSWRDKYKGKLHSAGDYDNACTAMLDSLSDEYTFFRDVSSTGERKTEAASKNVVTAKTFKNSIGYIKIRTFSARACVDETRAALKQMMAQRALILDLRDNWGGSIDDAFAVFQMIVENGGFVKIVGREDAASYSETLSVDGSQAARTRDGELVTMSRETCLIPHLPILILVNKESKSASEMLAGALKDNNRAFLVGENTFGKGVVQQVWEFDNGTSVKITSARFFRPSGAPIQGCGLAPDIKVAVSRSTDSQLQRAIQLAYSNARKHLAYRIAPSQGRSLSAPANRQSSSDQRNLLLRQSASGSR